MNVSKHIPLDYKKPSSAELAEKSRSFLELMRKRRSVRHFSEEEIPFEVIKNIVKTALPAPSGANRQPWKFVIVRDADTKRKIRTAAEAAEKLNYEKRFPPEMKEDLKALKTGWKKEFLETAPVLIAVFKEKYRLREGKKEKTYYAAESTGIACGFLIAAIHNAGLVTLPYTPAPAKFITEILKRPENESPFILFPVGYPAEGAEVPELEKGTFEEKAVLV